MKNKFQILHQRSMEIFYCEVQEMVTVEAFFEGLYVTILGVTVVFAVLAILALAIYGIGYLERVLVKREKPAVVERLKKLESLGFIRKTGKGAHVKYFIPSPP